MDASGIPTAGTHAVWASPLGSLVRGGPGKLNFAGGIGDDTFVFIKAGPATGDRIIDSHLDLSDGGEHDTLQLPGFSAATHLDHVTVPGSTQVYRVVDGVAPRPTCSSRLSTAVGG